MINSLECFLTDDLPVVSHGHLRCGLLKVLPRNPCQTFQNESDEMKENFLAHYVRVTRAAFNMEEMLVGVFIDLTQREFAIVPHELQIIESGGNDFGRSRLAGLLRYTKGGKRL